MPGAAAGWSKACNLKKGQGLAQFSRFREAGLRGMGSRFGSAIEYGEAYTCRETAPARVAESSASITVLHL